MAFKTLFKVGDQVYEGVRFRSWGIIEEINIRDTYPIKVRFKDYNACYRFLPDGKYTDGEPPTLSFTEYNLIEGGLNQERPEILPEKGDIVWVRDEEGQTWVITHFIETDKDRPSHPFRCSVGNREDICSYWRFMTTQNPYK